jgi:hypothetical protein
VDTLKSQQTSMMAVAAAQKNREMFAIKKSYSIEVSIFFFAGTKCKTDTKKKPKLATITDPKVLPRANKGALDQFQGTESRTLPK